MNTNPIATVLKRGATACRKDKEALHSYLQRATVLRIGPYRFYFYSHEPNEPLHVHVDKDSSSVKFWLEPIVLAENTDMPRKDLNETHRLVIKNQKQLLEKWYAFFGTQKR